MRDRPVSADEEFASILERRERLSPKQRSLLDAILNKRGIDRVQTRQADDPAIDGQAPPQRDENDASHQHKGLGGERRASGADRSENEKGHVPPFLFNLWQQVLEQTDSKLDLGLSEWIDNNGLFKLWKESEIVSPTSQLPLRGDSSPSPLVVMRGTGSKIPFFCVHALLGSVFHYHRLAILAMANVEGSGAKWHHGRWIFCLGSFDVCHRQDRESN